jgi:DNA gyrase subunit A
VIHLIRTAPDASTARERLMARDWPAEDIAPLIALIDDPRHRVVDGTYRLSEEQARAILELRLHRLTALGRDEIADELRKIGAEIADHLDVLGSRPRLLEIVRRELVDVRDRFANPRRTTIEAQEFEHDIEDLIQREDMVVSVTQAGYVKRVPVSAYRSQRRGGKGRMGMSMREEDFATRVFVASTHAPVLFFTNIGKV